MICDADINIIHKVGTAIIDSRIYFFSKENNFTASTKDFIVFKINPPKLSGGIYFLCLVNPLTQDQLSIVNVMDSLGLDISPSDII